ncbi:MAG: 1-acyl-sn-glycerol-3-phosphate acyltransferase [Cyclobacteriaceae bacterium]|nr:1-acyl-sn-glycerol-3-phosphate acyltransferase [Cyclobacteriaceae bacterium]
MLYSILRFLFRLTVKGYFRAIYIKGQEHIPRTGPVIFAPNHPSAFMDPILLSTQIDRKLFFLARGDIFQKQVTSTLFSWINMIPVYRKGETQGHGEKNDMVFQKCFDHLAKGKSLMIFPEGNSKTERRLRPLKTGVARIALGAESLNEFKLGVKIIPVGINYADPHTFRTDVFINFGSPISAEEYKAMFMQDEREGAALLTERLRSELEKVLVIVQDERLEKLVSQIEQLYRSKLRETLEPADKGSQDFQLSKDIVQAVDYHINNNPERVELFQANIDAYMNGLKELNIRDAQVRASNINLDVMRSLFYFVTALPLFLYGYITNYIPYRLAGIISDLIPLREDFVGSIKIAVGMFVFLIVYVAQATIVGLYTNVWWALLFITSLYPAGVFTLNYLKRYFQVSGTLKYLRLFMRKSDLVAKLKITRQQLIDKLEAGKEEYLLNRN